MKQGSRHAIALATLAIPLVLLGGFGWAELQRLGTRAQKALEDQALQLLKNAHLRLSEQLRGKCQRLLGEFDFGTESLAHATRELAEQHSEVQDLFVLDAGGNLLYPRLPPPQSSPLPLHTGSAALEITLAEAQELAMDWRGALRTLEDYLARGERDPRAASVEAKMRATFQLGGIARRLGQRERAVEAYEDSRVLASVAGREPPGYGDAPAIELLAGLALAELDPRPAARLELLQQIVDGRHDMVHDDILDEVATRLARGVPAGAPETAAAQETLPSIRMLLTGRRFAREYQALVSETMRGQLAKPPRDEFTLRLWAGSMMPALLVIRPCRGDEAQQLTERVRAAVGPSAAPHWIGLRLHAALVLNELMDPLLTPDENGFSLAILDPTGTPLLPAGPLPGDQLTSPSVHDYPTLAELRLRAIPVDPEANLRNAQAAARNRLLLVLALCMLAGGGALFLVRSVNREAELAQLKLHFVSRVSHELKTPLALIKMYGETLNLGRAQGADQVPRFGGIISREADRLTLMIDRVLDFSSQEAGTLRYAPERLDLSDLLLSVTDEYRPRVEEQGASLSVTFCDEAWVDVDPEAMHNAIVNLLENALKYTPATSADRTIEIDVARSGGRVRLEVRDRGVGIPETEREKVFGGFYRASTAGEARGVGLGLSLVKHFVTHHHGSVVALGREGGGTILRLELPLAPSGTGPAAEPAPSSGSDEHEKGQ